MFFLALLPLYVRPERLTGPMAALVALALLAGAATAYLGAVAIGAGPGRLGAGPKWIEAAGAVCLIGFGILAVAAPIG